jgi:hypothetical protein
MKPHACPICHGAGHVTRPPWVAGDVDHWAGSSAGSYPCRTCGGSGVLWSCDPPAPKPLVTTLGGNAEPDPG